MTRQKHPAAGYIYRTRGGITMPIELVDDARTSHPELKRWNEKRRATWRKWQELGLPLPDSVTGRCEIPRPRRCAPAQMRLFDFSKFEVA